MQSRRTEAANGAALTRLSDQDRHSDEDSIKSESGVLYKRNWEGNEEVRPKKQEREKHRA